MCRQAASVTLTYANSHANRISTSDFHLPFFQTIPLLLILCLSLFHCWQFFSLRGSTPLPFPTHPHFPSPSLLSLISTSQSPRRVFFPIENKLLREHTCQHTVLRAFPRLRTATNGCCHYFTNCLLCASPPSHL